LFDPHIRIKNGCRPLVDPDRRTKIMDLIRKGIFRYEAENWIRYLDLTEEAAHFLREVSSLPIQAPVSKHAEAWIRLIDKWLAHRGRKEDIVEGLLSYLTLLRDWNCDISIEYFLEIITSLVRERKKDMVPGVRVADAEAGRGLSAPAVIILGLHDGFFPPSQPTFQLLTDAQREKLEDRTEFPLAHSKVRHKESFCSLFSELIGAATAVLVLSRCHSDADGRERSPSLFYTAAQEVLRNICGVNPPIQKQTGDVIPDDDEILSSRELKIASVYKCFNRWETTKPVAGISILRSPYFRMRLKDEYKRYTQPKGGTWDGRGMKISDRLPLETWRTKGLRVTALEDYKSCPFRFFAEHILGLKPVREAVTPTPEQRGTLWHGVLTKFLKEFIVTGQLPSQERLKEIAIEELDGLRDQIPKPFFEALEKEVILLCGKIHSAEQREAMEWVPLKVEEDIKLKASEWGGEGFLTDLIVIMRPDRVDKARADPEKLRVVDYKTGGAPGPKEVREGLHLVLPLSSGVLGAQEFVFLRALEYTTEGKYGASCRAPSQNLPKIDEAFRIAKDYVLTALQEMSEGHFTVDPYDSSACQMCGRQAFCRKGSMRITYRS
ncbi:MAG: PD-(D/E)XK nuclease family protein, partial [Candidatus Caldarchaeum sp.]